MLHCSASPPPVCLVRPVPQSLPPSPCSRCPSDVFILAKGPAPACPMTFATASSSPHAPNKPAPTP